MTNLEEKGNKPLSYLLLTVTRGFYALFIIITWLVRKAELIGSENFTWCVRPRDFAEIFISLKAPRGLPIHRLEVKYWFFVHPNINKTNRITENNIFLKKIFITVSTYFVTGPPMPPTSFTVSVNFRSMKQILKYACQSSKFLIV